MVTMDTIYIHNGKSLKNQCFRCIQFSRCQLDTSGYNGYKTTRQRDRRIIQPQNTTKPQGYDPHCSVARRCKSGSLTLS